MLIGEVSKKYNVPIETLRYYEKIGLLVPRRKNKNRYYSQEDIDKLTYILQMKKLMFSLEEIKRILAIDQKIDEGLLNRRLALVEVQNLSAEVSAKYQEVLKKEKEILEVKKTLANLLVKIDHFKKGSNSTNG